MNRWIRMALAVVAALAAGGCATTDYVTGRSTRNLYAISEDIALGQQVLQQSVQEMQAQGVPVNRDVKRVGQLQDMVRRIAAVSHAPDLPYEVYLFETNIVNAMAAPGGKMLVFSGLYDPQAGLVKDENELAAVIGHEIAHVTCRHTTEALTRQAPINMLLLVGGIAAGLADNDDLALAIGAAFLVYNGLWVPKYSRKDEVEADRVGLMYMAKAGYDPRAAPRLWKRAYERDGGSSGLATILSTHPAHAHRWKTLEADLPMALAEYDKARGVGVGAPPATGSPPP